MLKSVRYAGLRVRVLRTVWLHPLAAPTIMAACGPRRMSVAMSTTYDTDMFDPLAIGNCTLKPDVSDDTRTSHTSGRTGESVALGTSDTNVAAPTAMTVTMYQRARRGRSRSKTSVYGDATGA